jgi:phospholipase D-like protein
VNGYPLLGVFWTTLWFFLFVAWMYVLIGIITDIFRSPDLSGWATALWVLFVMVFPWLGVVMYLIVRGDTLHNRYPAARS